MARSRVHGTSGGVELTDELVDQLAKEAEQGYDPARLRRRGRPPIGTKAAEVFQVRLEPDLKEALERAASRERTSPSEVARKALRKYLMPTTGRPRALK